MHAILIVDDFVPGCRALARLLTRLEERAICVESGELALAYLREHLPKLIILDVMMPVMDGMDVLRLLRANERFKDVAVVMFSALSDPEVKQRATDAGANGFWVKGEMDYEKLEQMVKPYLAEAAT